MGGVNYQEFFTTLNGEPICLAVFIVLVYAVWCTLEDLQLRFATYLDKQSVLCEGAKFMLLSNNKS